MTAPAARLPQPRLFVEEHRQLSILCACGCINLGQFPAWVSAPVQYGPRIQAQSILLNIDYKLPFAKLTQLWADLTGQAYNPATLANAQATLYKQLGPLETQVRQQLQEAEVCHFDETGLRVGGKLAWLHVACNAFFTYLFVHPSRGQKALKATQSVFEGCTHWLVHDCCRAAGAVELFRSWQGPSCFVWSAPVARVTGPGRAGSSVG